jgi:adenine C2-methylase RlmN of 23S rRNA A2503 and tRNA A37
MIDNITDTEDNMVNLTDFVDNMNKDIHVKQICFNRLAENDYKKLGIPFLLCNEY